MSIPATQVELSDRTALSADARPLESPSLKALAIRGSLWTIAGYGTSQILRLAGNLILTRLLFPEAFGVMALVSVLVQGLEMFSDTGIGPSIIQSPRGEDTQFLNTAWTIQVFRGIILWVVSCALAWPAAWYYRQPLLVQLLPVAGLTALIAGLNSTALILANRRMALGRLTLIEIVSYTIGLTVTVAWARISPSVWAFVGGSLVSAGARMVASHTLMQGTPCRFCWDRDSRKALTSFGKWIFLTTACTFLAGNLDRLMLGRYIPMDALGKYSIAFFLSTFLAQAVSRTAHQVLLPAFSRIIRDRPESLPRAYYRARLPLELMCFPLVGMLMATSPQVIALLYDIRYADAGWMLQVLSVRAAFYCCLPPMAVCLLAMGKPQYAFWGTVLHVLWLAIAIPLAWHLQGLWGATWAITLSPLPVAITCWYAIARHRLLSIRREGIAPAAILIGWLLGLPIGAAMKQLLS